MQKRTGRFNGGAYDFCQAKTIGLTAPNPKEATPSLRMFSAAFWSRSKWVLHSEHVQERSARVRFLVFYVHKTEQHFVVADHLSICFTLFRTFFFDWCFSFFRKLTEGEVRYLFCPISVSYHFMFRSSKKKKNRTFWHKLYSEFPVVVCSLIFSFLVDTGYIPTATVSIIRTLDLPGMCLLCFWREFISVLFVEHRRRIAFTVTAS